MTPTEQQAILQAIEKAFAVVPYPGDDGIVEMHYALCGAPCINCVEVRELFVGRHWKDHFQKPYDLLGYFPPREPAIRMCRDSVPLLKDEAFHFWLPLFLSAILLDEDEADLLITSVLGKFCPQTTQNPSWLLLLMTEEQRMITIDVLRPFAGFAHEKQALENLRIGVVTTEQNIEHGDLE